MKRILCTCSENWVRPELSIPAAGQKDRGSGDENALIPMLKKKTRRAEVGSIAKFNYSSHGENQSMDGEHSPNAD